MDKPTKADLKEFIRFLNENGLRICRGAMPQDAFKIVGEFLEDTKSKAS